MAFDFGTMGTIFQLGGALSSMIGGFYQADMMKSNLKFQANMAKINANIDELAAENELLKGQREIGAITMGAGKLKSSQRAAMAANGVDLGVGSAAELQASTDLMKEIDKNTAQSNALHSAWGYRMQAVNQKNSALMANASASGISPWGAAFSSLLGSAGSVAQSWYRYNSNAPGQSGVATGQG